MNEKEGKEGMVKNNVVDFPLKSEEQKGDRKPNTSKEVIHLLKAYNKLCLMAIAIEREVIRGERGDLTHSEALWNIREIIDNHKIGK